MERIYCSDCKYAAMTMYRSGDQVPGCGWLMLQRQAPPWARRFVKPMDYEKTVLCNVFERKE